MSCNCQCNAKLNTYLANLAVWNVKLHSLHWNVTGFMFHSLHEYTESLYNEVFGAYDDVAELMKMRDHMPMCTMAEYIEVATIKELPAADFTACETMRAIQGDIELMLKLAKEIRDEAAEKDDFQTQAMFEGFMEGFVKQLWFIRAMAKGHGSKPAEGTCPVNK